MDWIIISDDGIQYLMFISVLNQLQIMEIILLSDEIVLLWKKLRIDELK